MLRTRLNKETRGFTLVEMMAVVTVLAILAAAVVPLIAHWQAGDDYRAFPGRLMNLIGNAKADAIAQKQPRSVGYDESTGDFRVFWTDPDTSQEQEGKRLSVPSDYELGRLVLNNIDTTPQDWRLTFYPDGTADKAGIELRDQDRYLSVSVDTAGPATMTREALPEASESRWSAGDNEVRQ